MVAETLVAADIEKSTKSEREIVLNMEPGEAANVSLSAGSDVLDKIEVDTVSIDNFPKDAVDEWPAPKKIHVYYFIKFRSYEDPQLKAKIDQADRELQKKNEARLQIFDQIKSKRSERSAIIEELKPLTAENRRYKDIADEKRKDMEPLHAALGKIRSANNVGLCSSEEELNELIQSLHYRMHHESNTLAEEKQMLKEIKLLEGSREKVIANVAMKAKLQDTFGQREEIRDQLKLIGGDLGDAKKERSTVKSKIKQLEEQLKIVHNEIALLQEKLTGETEKKKKAMEVLHTYKKQREERNAPYYENRSILNKAKDLAAKKDIAAVGELSHIENEKCITEFKSSKAWRVDYGNRILQSLDFRHLSRDGRIRNPDEKPLIAVLTNSHEPQAMPVQAQPAKIKEEGAPVKDSISKKTDDKKLKDIDTNGTSTNAPEEAEYFVPEKTLKESSVSKVVDVAKTKEIKREEEAAKAKLAMERKKKLAEKAAAKAAARAQKETEKKEKKEKDREKKAKKKAEASAASTDGEPAEVVSEEVESETAPAETPTPITSDVRQKENAKIRKRSKVQLPHQKVMPRRKRAPAYQKWIIPTGIGVAVLLLAVLAYFYLF